MNEASRFVFTAMALAVLATTACVRGHTIDVSGDSAGGDTVGGDSAGGDTVSAGDVSDGDSIPCVGTAIIIGVAASASQDAAHNPEKTLDGVADASSYWAAEGDGQWIAYELDREVRLDTVEIAFHRGNERQAYFDIQVSTDGTVWSTVLAAATSTGSSLALQTFTFGCVAARHVRILGHGNSLPDNDWNSYTEVEIEDFAVDIDVNPVEYCGDATCNNGETCYDCSADCGSCSTGTIVFVNDFEDNALGVYPSVAAFQSDWNSTSAVTRLNKMATVSGVAGNPTQSFRLFYPFYDSTDFCYICWSDNRCTSSTGERELFTSPPSFGNVVFLNGVGPSSGGVQFKTALGGRDELFLSYKIMFGDEFYPVDGGKLPGLCGGICQGGGAVADPDGDGTSDGFSARLMFEKEHDGYPITLRFYVYHMDQTGTYGDSVIFSKGVAPGEWHTITQRVRMNTLNVGNGVTEAWLDGELVASRANFKFRQGTTANFTIDAILFSTFFGGGGTTVCSDAQVSAGAYGCSTYSNGDNYYFYAPRKDEYVYLDDVVVYY